MRVILLFSFLFLLTFKSKAQDISLLNLHGQLPSTYLNPGLKVDKKFNLSLAGVNVLLGTDGPSINQITSKNSEGKRYIDIGKLDQNLEPYQNIFFNNDIHTIDVSLKVGNAMIMAGHAFRSTSNVRYPSGLVNIAAQGNAAFIGQTIEIAPYIDVNAYNEIYLGLQKSFGNLTIGAKGKLLYGVANIQTDKANIGFTTDDEIYQLSLQTDYEIRSSALLRYNSLDSITVDYSGFSFDNMFYNNQGFAFDLGASYSVNEKFTISASMLDIGKINWDFFPRKYTSKGNFSFDGVDILDLLVDSTSISIQDTLTDLLKVTEQIENYSTTLSGTYTLGANYLWGEKWRFSALLLYQKTNNASRNMFSVSAVRKISIFDLGVQYSITKNNFAGLGIFGKVKLGPISAFASTDNIIGAFKPFDARSASVRIGATFQI